jgi:predicted DNA-binding transcriptional regulator YafY
MRAGRLLTIMLLLQVHRRMTARDLAARLEVSERTILRDMDALAAAGVPVYAQRGAGGGWILPDEYGAPVAALSEAEVQALFSAQPLRLLSDLGLGNAARDAALKVLAAIPAASRTDASRVLERIHIDVPSWRRESEPVPLLPLLQQALWSDRRIAMTYRRGDGSIVEREVDPLGLVAKGHLWYLVAASGGDLRTYRVRRVESVTLLDDPVVRPPDFNLASWWSEASARFLSSLPRFPVSLLAQPAVLRELERPGGYVQVQQVGDPDSDGRVRLDLLFETEDDACGYLLSFGDRVEVISPAALRERVVILAQAVLSVYRPETVSSRDR